MTAVVLYHVHIPSLEAVRVVIGLGGFLFALIALVMHGEQTRRIVGAFLLVVFLASATGTVLRADDGDPGFVMNNLCKDLTPWDWRYWELGCIFLP